MAKKATRRASAARSQQRAPTPSDLKRRRFLVGGVLLLLILGAGVLVRTLRQQALTPRLQGATDNHYTRGTAGAPVIIKEFSDYT